MSSFNVSCDSSSIIINHLNEVNEEEILVLPLDELFGDIDIFKRTEDGEIKVSIWAKVDTYELALVLGSVVNYIEAKMTQFKEG